MKYSKEYLERKSIGKLREINDHYAREIVLSIISMIGFGLMLFAVVPLALLVLIVNESLGNVVLFFKNLRDIVVR